MELSEKEMAYAVKILDTICTMLDEEELRYDRVDEKMAVIIEFNGNDFPLKTIFKITPDRQLVTVISPISFKIPDNERTTAAMALTMLNDCIYDGVWTEDLGTGEVQFRMTNSYRDSIIGKECFKSMMYMAANATNDLADKLFMVGKGNMSLQQFYDSVFHHEPEDKSE